VKKRGRKPTTGRYATREELERMVRLWYYDLGKNISEVARVCRVAQVTVAKILDKPVQPVTPNGDTPCPPSTQGEL
jgi:hypothetical protein